MHNVIVNMNTLKVVNYDTKCKPFEFSIEIENINNVKKFSQEKVKNHKTLFGERLYTTEYNNNNIQIVESQIKNRICEPVFEYVEVNKEVSLVDFPTKFTLDDIVNFKKEELKSNKYSTCKLYEIELSSLVDKTYKNHKADIGYKILKIHKNGEIKFNNIEFDTKINNLYIPVDLNKLDVKYKVNNEKDFLSLNGNSLLLEDNIKSIELIIINKTDEAYEFNNFYILGK